MEEDQSASDAIAVCVLAGTTAHDRTSFDVTSVLQPCILFDTRVVRVWETLHFKVGFSCGNPCCKHQSPHLCHTFWAVDVLMLMQMCRCTDFHAEWTHRGRGTSVTRFIATLGPFAKPAAQLKTRSASAFSFCDATEVLRGSNRTCS